MQKLFEFIGKKAGEAVKKSKWIYSAVFGTEEEALNAEYQFGLQMAKELQREAKLVNSEYLNSISKKLIERLNTKRKFQFILIHSNETNAYAIPGGFIFFTDNLLNFCESDDEVAFVLAHEIGHIIKGHSFNRLLADYSLSAIGRFVRVNGVFSHAVKEITTKYLSSKYSRENELAADEFAIKLLKAAKFNTGAASGFFKKLERLHQNEGNELADYFSSHPSPQVRLKKVMELTS